MTTQDGKTSSLLDFSRRRFAAARVSATAWLLSVVAALIVSNVVLAHNNPTFREDLLQTIAVDPSAAPNSEVFRIEYPDMTVQLIWRVVGIDESAPVTLNLLQDGESVAEFVSPEGATNRFEGDGFSLSVDTGETAFTVELYAKVLDRSKEEK